MNKKDGFGLAVMGGYIATGRYVSAAIQGLKNWKAIVAIFSSALIATIVIISIIACMPGMIMQSIMPKGLQEKQETLVAFAETEISTTEAEKKNFIMQLLDSLSTEDESAKLVGDEPSKEEILIIYATKYGGYFDEKQLDKSKIHQITKSFLGIDGLTVYVKPFEQVVTEMGLTDEQQTIALNMYGSYMFDQTIPITGGDALQNFGNVTYKNGATEVVYYSQRDERWANNSYGDSTIGRAGCGPTSLAMVISSLTSKKTDPQKMCDWAYRNGYKCKGGGSYWSLIPNGAEAFGLTVESSVKEAQDLVDALADGKLIIAIMGPGHFTSSGHFIVLRGVTEEGKILVADSYSTKNTGKEWDLNTIIGESKKGSASGGPFWIISK